MNIMVLDDEGSGPALAYLPGIGGTALSAEPCIERLRESFRVIRLCYRSGDGAFGLGGGSAGGCPVAPTYAGLAAQVSACLREVGVAEALLLAESFGGALAMRTALEFPDQVRGLAIVNSFAWHPWRMRLRLGRAVGRVLTPGMHAWLRRWFGIRKLVGPRLTPAIRASMAARRPVMDAAYRARIEMICGLDMRSDLPKLSKPVALFASDRDVIVPSIRCAEEMQTLLPDASVRRLEDAGHFVLAVAAFDWPAWLAELAARADRSSAREA